MRSRRHRGSDQIRSSAFRSAARTPQRERGPGSRGGEEDAGGGGVAEEGALRRRRRRPLRPGELLDLADGLVVREPQRGAPPVALHLALDLRPLRLGRGEPQPPREGVGRRGRLQRGDDGDGHEAVRVPHKRAVRDVGVEDRPVEAVEADLGVEELGQKGHGLHARGLKAGAGDDDVRGLLAAAGEDERPPVRANLKGAGAHELDEAVLEVGVELVARDDLALERGVLRPEPEPVEGRTVPHREQGARLGVAEPQRLPHRAIAAQAHGGAEPPVPGEDPLHVVADHHGHLGSSPRQVNSDFDATGASSNNHDVPVAEGASRGLVFTAVEHGALEALLNKPFRDSLLGRAECPTSDDNISELVHLEGNAWK
mmetsp:Transcript_12054/g.28584  ORF Transcript_12054/g.28584 Transcript_12054/m.28584 type:complete len:370 (-) Transcript_12054:642-1751(-)